MNKAEIGNAVGICINRSLIVIYILVFKKKVKLPQQLRENTGVPHNITSRSLSLQHHEHQATTILTAQAKSNGHSLKTEVHDLKQGS